MISHAENPGTPDYNSLLTGERLARTYGQLLVKRPVVEATIDTLGLKLTPSELTEMIDVRVIRETQLVEISVEHASPDVAATIANTLASVFITQVREDSLGDSSAYHESLRKQLGDLDAAVKETKLRLQELRETDGPKSDIAYLQSLLTQYQSTYAQAIRDEQEMRLAEARAGNQVKVAEPAEAPTLPISPKVLQNTLLAAMVGLILASVTAFLFEYLDDTVKTPQDVENIAGLPTLGQIVRFPRGSHLESPLSGRENQSEVAEAFRALRTNVDFARVGIPGKTMLVTSAIQGEGKTTTAVNLAAINAIAGRTVVLVDADLRRPSAHKSFNLDNKFGLTTLLLRDDVPVESMLQSAPIQGLLVLASGPIPPNPAELLASARMGRIIEELKDGADVVIFDCPPLLAVSDPVILGAKLEGVALVIDSGRTRAEMLYQALAALERGAVPVLGVVLNKFSKRTAGGYALYPYYGRARRKREASSEEHTWAE